ncbi:unannotated protein [freshwater metagenome]|uniref:Unannotated protein n=1 Tax=freshwater metagenome TaxID=449393 RepID=A0A6J5ZBJ1_9ZZZZ
MKKRLPLTIILPLLAAAATPAAASASVASSRAGDPIIATGARVSALLGASPQRIVAYRYAAKRLQQVPLQVDERKLFDVGNAYQPALPSGEQTLVYADAAMSAGADNDLRFDSNDEIALLGSSVGGKAPSNVALPSALRGLPHQWLKVRDPISGQSGYLLLGVARAGIKIDQAAGSHPLQYKFALASGQPYSSYRRAQGPNPESSSLTTPSYSLGFSDRWIKDRLKIRAKDSTGVDILDMHKSMISARSCGRSERTFSDGEGAFLTNRVGPVRAIRDFIGANSGPMTERRELMYPGREDVETFLRVHSIGTVVDFLDYSAAASGMTYRNNLNTAGVKVDGRPDVLTSGLPSWSQVSGDQGTLTVSYSHATTIVGLPMTGYYVDSTKPTDPQCTGDSASYAASGAAVTAGMTTTEPRQAGYSHFSTSWKLYFGGRGSGGAKNAAALDRRARQPLQPTSLR